MVELALILVAVAIGLIIGKLVLSPTTVLVQKSIGINFDIDAFLEMTACYLQRYLSFREIIEEKERFRKKINKMLY